MDTFTVILENWTELPHRELGPGFAAITGVHKQDAFTRLRRQQGIIFENLELLRARQLVEFFNENGFKAKAIPDHLVPQIGIPLLCRNADFLDDRIDIEDPYGNKQTMDPSTIYFAHAAWISEKSKPSDGRKQYFGKLSHSRGGPVEGFPWQKKSTTDSIGWVIHLFCQTLEQGCLRIVAKNFNFDYQGDQHIPHDARFAILLADIIEILPPENVDRYIHTICQQPHQVPEEVKFDTIDILLERLRWMLTERD